MTIGCGLRPFRDQYKRGAAGNVGRQRDRGTTTAGDQGQGQKEETKVLGTLLGRRVLDFELDSLAFLEN